MRHTNSRVTQSQPVSKLNSFKTGDQAFKKSMLQKYGKTKTSGDGNCNAEITILSETGAIIKDPKPFLDNKSRKCEIKMSNIQTVDVQTCKFAYNDCLRINGGPGCGGSRYNAYSKCASGQKLGNDAACKRLNKKQCANSNGCCVTKF